MAGMPMSPIAIEGLEPLVRSTGAMEAIGAHDLLSQAVQYIWYLVASTTVRHHPVRPGRFHVAAVDSAHLLNCKSVHIKKQILTLPMVASHLAIEVFHLRARLVGPACLDPPPQDVRPHRGRPKWAEAVGQRFEGLPKPAQNELFWREVGRRSP